MVESVFSREGSYGHRWRFRKPEGRHIAVFVYVTEHQRCEMRKTWLIAAALISFATAIIAAKEPRDQTNKPVEPPASGSGTSDLNRSGGVIAPPSGIDPEIKQT